MVSLNVPEWFLTWASTLVFSSLFLWLYLWNAFTVLIWKVAVFWLLLYDIHFFFYTEKVFATEKSITGKITKYLRLLKEKWEPPLPVKPIDGMVSLHNENDPCDVVILTHNEPLEISYAVSTLWYSIIERSKHKALCRRVKVLGRKCWVRVPITGSKRLDYILTSDSLVYHRWGGNRAPVKLDSLITEVSVDLGRTKIQDLLFELNAQHKFTEESPPWRIIGVKNTDLNAKTQDRVKIYMRYHHSLMDGVSAVAQICEFVFKEKHIIEEYNNMFTRRTRAWVFLSSWLYTYRDVVPYFFGGLWRGLQYELNRVPRAPFEGKKLFSAALDLNMEKIRRFQASVKKSHLLVSVNDIVLTAVVRAHTRLFIDSLKDLDTEISTTAAPSSPSEALSPASTLSSTSRNTEEPGRKSVSVLKGFFGTRNYAQEVLPTMIVCNVRTSLDAEASNQIAPVVVMLPRPENDESFLPHLAKVSSTMEPIKKRKRAFVIANLVNASMSVLPDVVNQWFFDHFGHAEILVSNLVGPKRSGFWGDSKVHQVSFWPPARGVTRITVSVLTYGGNTQLMVSADRSLEKEVVQSEVTKIRASQFVKGQEEPLNLADLLAHCVKEEILNAF